MRSCAAAVAACLCVALPAEAGEQWILREPTLASVTKEWREGTLAAGTDEGHPFVSLRTDGAGAPALMAARGIAPSADARRHFLAVTLRVRGVAHLQNLQLRLASDSCGASWFAFPVRIYADGEYNFLQENTWASFTASFGEADTQGTPDRARIDCLAVMATDDGKGRVEVDLAGAALVEAPKQGVVSFTFDDGYKEHLEAIRLLAQRGWRGTAYIIPFALGSKPAYLTEADVAEIAKLGSDVAAHDDPPFTQVPAAELEPRIRGVQRWLVDHGFGEGAKHLAYPLGKQEPERVRPTIARVFTTARLAGGGPETLPPADPQLLRAVNVIEGTPPEQVGAWARRARDEGEWLILMFHWLPETTAKHTDYTMADYRRVLDAVAAAQVRVAPVTEVWREIAPRVAERALFPPPSLPAKSAR
jgi:peptidoglycan/xylan/chitin deacetylase (PgdA/CDA1 family)